MDIADIIAFPAEQVSHIADHFKADALPTEGRHRTHAAGSGHPQRFAVQAVGAHLLHQAEAGDLIARHGAVHPVFGPEKRHPALAHLGYGSQQRVMRAGIQAKRHTLRHGKRKDRRVKAGQRQQHFFIYIGRGQPADIGLIEKSRMDLKEQPDSVLVRHAHSS